MKIITKLSSDKFDIPVMLTEMNMLQINSTKKTQRLFSEFYFYFCEKTVLKKSP